MKTFDPTSIKNRMITTLKDNQSWNSFYDVGVISQLLNTVSESEFELARYFEYLLREAMWTHARNATSVFSNAKMLGYNPLRKVSAIGTIYISHDPDIYTNINVVNPSTGRTLGEQILYYEETEDSGDYDDIPLSEYAGGAISIGFGTALTINNINYVVADDYVYPEAGSTNLKYLKVTVVQGIAQTVNTSTSDIPPEDVPALGDDYEAITLTSLSVEAAQNTYTKEFFSVTETNTGLNITYNPIDNILLASFDDPRFDIQTNLDFQAVLRFGNNVTGVKLTAGSVLAISYLATDGSLGNVESLYNLIEFTVTPQSFTGVNLSSITGGSEGDSVGLSSLAELLKIKERAPLQYLTIESIITTTAYQQAIEAFPNVNQASVFPGTFTDVGDVEKDAVFFSALYDDGSVPIASEIEDLVITELAYKKPPLDILKFQEPLLTPVRLYFKGEIQTSGTSIPETQTSLFEYFSNLYVITNRAFQEKFSVANSYLSEIGTISLVPDTRYILAEAILDYTEDDITYSALGFTTLEKTWADSFNQITSYGYQFRIFIECAGEQYVYYKFLTGALKRYIPTLNNVFPTDFQDIDASDLVDVSASDPVFKNTSDVTLTDDTLQIIIPSALVTVNSIIRAYAVIQAGLVQPTLEYEITYIPESIEGEQSSEIVVECTDLIRNY